MSVAAVGGSKSVETIFSEGSCVLSLAGLELSSYSPGSLQGWVFATAKSIFARTVEKNRQ